MYAAIRFFPKVLKIELEKAVVNEPCRAREIVGFAGSGPIFETENRFISRQEAEKSVCISQNFAIYRLTLSPVKIVHT